MFDNYPDLMTIYDLQNALGIGRSMAYRLINNDEIKHFRIGSSIKVPKQFLVDYIEKSCYANAVAENLPS
jgi:excisionase family DNA binding protein